MINSKTLRKIDKLEKIINPSPLIVLCMLENGEKAVLPAKECVEKNADFIKVVSGGNLNDLEIILKDIYKKSITENEVDI